MNLHYLKIAVRNLVRQKVLAAINILGLSVGIGCFTLFLLYAVNEFSYDRFHKNEATIYRVYDWRDLQGREPYGDASSHTPLGPAMKKDFPDVLNYVRFQGGWGQQMVRAGNKIHRSEMSFADPQLLTIFSFPLLSGNAATALKDPHNIVITKDKAMELFGNTNIIGKTVEINLDNGYEPFNITAVADNIPDNSSIHFGILGSFDFVLNTEMGKRSANNWHMSIGIETYVQLREGSKLMNETDKLARFRHQYYADDDASLIKDKLWDGKGSSPLSFRLQPLGSIHTTPEIDGGPVVDPKNIWILIGIAAGILLIACINFTTLAIGRSAGRAKEVGVRKAIGGKKTQLIYQFLTESLLLSIFSAGIGLMLAYILLPLFNELAGTKLNFSFSRFPEMAWLLAALTLLAGLLAGTYPALVLSGFRTVEVLKSKVKLAGSNLFTKSLVTFQFVLSIGLIISTIIILQQLSFMRSKDLGFNKENVVAIDVQGSDTKKIYPLFRQALATNPQIAGVTASVMGLGGDEGQMGGGYEFNGKKEGVIEYPVDPDFLKVMGMQLIAGRNFNASVPSDTISSVIVNESLVNNLLGVTPQIALGLQFKSPQPGSIPKTIIGVSKDFNYEPLTHSIRPQLFRQPAQFNPSRFFVRIGEGDPSVKLAALQAALKNVAPDLPFSYSFLDEKFDIFYKSEQRWSSIVGWAGGICIFLACLGLSGLAALAAVNRTKEIGIRKVLGAPVTTIVRLLSIDFVKLVCIAIIVAAPLAWYFMNNWLKDYAYRIDISWWVFAITGAIAIMIAFLTIGLQAAKAGMSNPVKSLRTE